MLKKKSGMVKTFLIVLINLKLPDMSAYRRTCPDMVGHGRTWSDMSGHSGISYHFLINLGNGF